MSLARLVVTLSTYRDESLLTAISLTLDVLTNSLDIEATITNPSTVWCAAELRSRGRYDVPKASEFINSGVNRSFIIPAWYLALIHAARAYVTGGGTLSLAPKPHDGYGWVARQMIAAELASDLNTYGLDYASAAEASESSAANSEEPNESDMVENEF